MKRCLDGNVGRTLGMKLKIMYMRKLPHISPSLKTEANSRGLFHYSFSCFLSFMFPYILIRNKVAVPQQDSEALKHAENNSM